jgi:hypothetical protein
MDDFETYWPEFVRAHAHKTTRLVHLGGTLVATGVAALGLLTRRPLLLALALPIAVGPAQVAHAVLDDADQTRARREGPRQLLFAVRANFRMFGKMFAGTMDAEVERVTAPPPRSKTNGGGKHVAVNVPRPTSPLN